MQYGMHSTIELMRVESDLLSRELKYHYLVADERARHPRPAILTNLAQSIRAFFAPRAVLSEQQRGI